MPTLIAWEVPRRKIRWWQVREVFRNAVQGWCRILIVSLSLLVLCAGLVEAIQPGIGVPWFGWKSGVVVISVSLLIFGFWLSTLWPFAYKVEIRDTGLFIDGQRRMKWSDVEGFSLSTHDNNEQKLFIKGREWKPLAAPVERLPEIVAFLSSRCERLPPTFAHAGGKDFRLTPRYVTTGLLLSVFNALCSSFAVAALSRHLGYGAIIWGLLFGSALTGAGMVCGAQFNRSSPHLSKLSMELGSFWTLVTWFLSFIFAPPLIFAKFY